jgi:hypothetical protein
MDNNLLNNLKNGIAEANTVLKEENDRRDIANRDAWINSLFEEQRKYDAKRDKERDKRESRRFWITIAIIAPTLLATLVAATAAILSLK